MQIRHKLRLATTIGLAAGALSLGLVVPSVSGATSLSGVVTIAEAPQAAPNYILPFTSSGNGFSVANMNQFQMLMYRPLYWFGTPGSSALSLPLSLGNYPTVTNGNRTFTINLKGWKFADGQTVNAASVMFFLNMYKAASMCLAAGKSYPGATACAANSIYGGYVPKLGIPDGVKSATGSGNTVTITMSSPSNPNWLVYNYLSEITPFPATWDVTSTGAAPGSGGCESGAFGSATTEANCEKVLTFLNTTANVTKDFTSTMWESGTDGPWSLKSIDALGNVTFVPNMNYSGPVKAHVSEVKLLAFTSTSAELSALRANSVDLGYVDATSLTAPAPGPGLVGPNLPVLASKYNLVNGLDWSFNYDLYNLKGDPASAALSQLYVRQALQYATNQPLTLKAVVKGYGVPTYSPLPYGAPAAISGPVPNPYPFNQAKALSLFASHGWKEMNGVQTCVKPGTAANECGAGVKKGFAMSLKMDQAAGSATDNELTAVETSEWNNIGVFVSINQDTFGNVLSKCQGAKTGFDLCDWGGGWIYAPDYYPSGEELFQTGASSNTGGYSNPTMDKLITASVSGNSKLTAYENYAAQQLPVFFKPNGVSPGEVIKTLKSLNGFKVNPLQNFMPEYYYF